MFLQIGRRSNSATQFCDIYWTTNLIQHSILCQLIRNCEYIHRTFLHTQVTYGRKNQCMFLVVKTLGIQGFTNYGIRILVYHQCAKHSFLHL